MRRIDFHTRVWKPALVEVGVIEEPKPGYASVLPDAGENIRALSTYLGHADPGLRLRTYTHLMPSGGGRTRKAVDAVYGTSDAAADGPQTVQGE
ncbi:integrase [Streptomyces sp. PvR034]|uniref:integrase n=1 Tax=Streptomyces sp. PvR034 TaxID=3156401 RepID=UPI00339795FF